MSGTRTKTLGRALKGAGAPEAAQLAVINGMALREHTAEELYVREFIVAHNGLDRDRESIDEALLDAMARTLPGKGLFVKHPTGYDGDSGPGAGRWFAARAERMTLEAARSALGDPGVQWPPDRAEAVLLFASAYLPRSDDLGWLIQRLDAGVAGFVSAGFTYRGSAEIKSAEGDAVGRRLLAPGEALEASIVWLGAQQGARAVKEFDPKEGATVTEQEKQALEARTKAAESAALAAKAAVDQLATLKTALGDQAGLLDQPGQLAKALADGQAHRKALIADLVALDREQGVLGDTPEAVAAAEKTYGAMGTELLTSLKARLEKAAPAERPAGRVAGGEPNERGTAAKVPSALDSVCLS